MTINFNTPSQELFASLDAHFNAKQSDGALVSASEEAIKQLHFVRDHVDPRDALAVLFKMGPSYGKGLDVILGALGTDSNDTISPLALMMDLGVVLLCLAGARAEEEVERLSQAAHGGN